MIRMAIAHYALTEVQLHHAQWVLQPTVAAQRLQVACRRIERGDHCPPCQRVFVRVHHRGRLRALGLLRPALERLAVLLQDEGVPDPVQQYATMVTHRLALK